MSAALSVEDLGKTYPAAHGPLVVLEGVTLRVQPGEALAIMGPSGSGKSSLLNIVGTLDRPTSGRVRVGTVDPFALGQRDLAAFRNQQVGFVFQEHHLLPQCTVLENVLLPTIPLGAAAESALSRAKMLLGRVGLAARADHTPAELSGGERQRAALARALINRPSILLADEPTGNLDRHTADTIAQLLLELQADERFILIVVTHSDRLADMLPRTYELRDAQLVEREVGVE
jgi:lipoprotein-releasing system ATP-binding protein